MTKLEWLSEDNVKKMTEILTNEFKTSIESVGDTHLYYQVLEGEMFNCKALDYALIKDDDKDVGIIGYYIPEKDPESAWLGWFTTIPAFRGKGHGKEALKLLIDELKNKYPDLHILRVYTEASNVYGIGFYKKAGFIQQENGFLLKGDESETVILNYSLDGSPIKEWEEEPIW